MPALHDNPAPGPDDLALARTWIASANTPHIARELTEIYDDVARTVDERSPACWASGRCCHFEAAGHRLYVTGLEAAFAQRLASAPATTTSVAAALTVGNCPFQIGHLCSERAARPLGCRTYFCDRSAQQWQADLTEQGLTRIRALHDAHDIPYRYAEWRSLLALLASTHEGSGSSA